MLGLRATLVLAAFLIATPHAAAGTLREVVFTSTSPLSGDAEMAQRLLSPLRAAHMPGLQARAKSGVSAQPVNPSQEKFLLYVPSQEPQGGYRLLVFVPPWDEAKLPNGWEDVFDQYGIIFVSASGSGNAASVLARRIPLAILAEQNVVQSYHVDPTHIFIGGFSGGARVAMRVALGYPDLFTGAFLDAGSDPIGTPDAPLPPRELFERFQSQSHLVYVTGDKDLPPLEESVVSQKSMRRWCVFHLDSQRIPGGFHSAAGPAALSRALDRLMQPINVDSGELTSCRSGLDTELSGDLQQVRAHIQSGERDAARQALDEIDQRFGGLAAPSSLELDEKISQMPK